ncbi:dihydroneopterin aldolase [Novosphingopyxis sp. YJ-S2-01]|uniref:dihydroneopterin aldolase n=1 Tax=Novosphingopyxis sp. YJ-S2-01 TaxID=2794021 RepID=UPI0018DBEF92|nr:dihydroneopterin aldolase [Novosphingopyxis sp. YJ-S2-01]MBH9538658.1 dihydroneopterin aldolase [Novosphingopyxis sp. YJ-S2-01]
MTDRLTLEVHDLDVDVLTGIYSQETHLPQPLRISISADLAIHPHYEPATPLSASKNYMDLREAATELPKGVHFTLVEAVADYIIDRVMEGDERVERVKVKIIKLAIAEAGEAIGITMERVRK